MERRLDLIQEVTGELSQALDSYAKVQGEIEILGSYYGSKEWRQDYDDDADGKHSSFEKATELYEKLKAAGVKTHYVSANIDDATMEVLPAECFGI